MRSDQQPTVAAENQENTYPQRCRNPVRQNTGPSHGPSVKIGSCTYRLRRRWQCFAAVCQKAVSTEQRTLISSPQHEVPGRTVPESTQKHCHEQVEVCART